ncbi:MAG: hypothetical protein QOI96_645, partial [Verrucomicrobiota bacterium]
MIVGQSALKRTAVVEPAGDAPALQSDARGIWSR